MTIDVAKGTQTTQESKSHAYITRIRAACGFANKQTKINQPINNLLTAFYALSSLLLENMHGKRGPLW